MAELLQAALPSIMSWMSKQKEQPIPGQDAANVNMSGLIDMNSKAGQISGQAPNVDQGPGVLPPRGAIAPPDGIEPFSSPMPGTTTNQGAQFPGSIPMNGTVQQAPVGAQPPYQDDRSWGGLIGGDVNHPNGLIRAGQGYHDTGLMGALGYLFSNMDKQPK